MKPMQQASMSVQVPEGFSGWWCERCEKAVTSIPDEAGSPAKCPHCRKWTVVWVPPAAMDVCHDPQPWAPRERLDPARGAELFARMRLEVNLGN